MATESQTGLLVVVKVVGAGQPNSWFRSRDRAWFEQRLTLVVEVLVFLTISTRVATESQPAAFVVL